MSDLIDRQAAIEYIKLQKWRRFDGMTIEDAILTMIREVPSAQPTLRERALMLLLNWAEECGFGYDNFPEEYERYKDEIVDMSYLDGMIYIAEKEVESNG